jgi:hypothetical protein
MTTAFRSTIVIAVAVTSFALAGVRESNEEPAHFKGPPPLPGYPDPFNLEYFLAGLTSPNKRYDIIYPSVSLDRSADFIVDLVKARVLAVLDTDLPYFQNKNHGDLDAHWAPDSSAVVVEVAGKWAPDGLILVEFHNDEVVRQSDLLHSLSRFFAAPIAKRTHVKESAAGVDELDLKAVEWKSGSKLQLHCEGMTNGKDFENESRWEGELTAIWDVAQHKFVSHAVRETNFRPARKERD